MQEVYNFLQFCIATKARDFCAYLSLQVVHDVQRIVKRLSVVPQICNGVLLKCWCVWALLEHVWE